MAGGVRAVTSVADHGGSSTPVYSQAEWDLMEEGNRKVAQALIAERDRLREALTRIAEGDVPGVTFADDDLISAFAQEALDA